MRGARRTLLALCISFAVTLALPAAASAVSQTFVFTGASQTFTVPAGVTQITVEALGAQGGASESGATGGLGGRAIATIAVTPDEVLQIDVGGQGGGPTNPAAGGFNGGGAVAPRAPTPEAEEAGPRTSARAEPASPLGS